jgi:hypothetical protein
MEMYLSDIRNVLIYNYQEIHNDFPAYYGIENVTRSVYNELSWQPHNHFLAGYATSVIFVLVPAFWILL